MYIMLFCVILVQKHKATSGEKKSYLLFCHDDENEKRVKHFTKLKQSINQTRRKKTT